MLLPMSRQTQTRAGSIAAMHARTLGCVAAAGRLPHMPSTSGGGTCHAAAKHRAALMVHSMSSHGAAQASRRRRPSKLLQVQMCTQACKRKASNVLHPGKRGRHRQSSAFLASAPHLQMRLQAAEVLSQAPATSVLAAAAAMSAMQVIRAPGTLMRTAAAKVLATSGHSDKHKSDRMVALMLASAMLALCRTSHTSADAHWGRLRRLLKPSSFARVIVRLALMRPVPHLVHASPARGNHQSKHSSPRAQAVQERP